MESYRPHIVLVVLDTVRSASLTDARTPNIDRLRQSGISCAHAVAPAPWTAPSHAAIFSGQKTQEHGIDKGGQVISSRENFFPTSLRREGYHTVGISNNPYVSSDFGYDSLFDTFHYRPTMLYTDGIDLAQVDSLTYRDVLSSALQHEQPLKSLTNAVFQRLFAPEDDGAKMSIRHALRSLEDDGTPQFLFVNLMEAHTDYWPPEPYRQRRLPSGTRRNRAAEITQYHWPYILGEETLTDEKRGILDALYTGAIEYLDHMVGQLVKGLEDAGLWEETLLFVVGDHGELLGEGGWMGHVGNVREELLHVPLVCSHPSLNGASHTIDCPVSLRWIHDAVTAAVEGEVRDSIVENLRRNEPVFAEYSGCQDDLSNLDIDTETRATVDQSRQVVYFDGWKYVHNEVTEDELFQLSDRKAVDIDSRPGVTESATELLAEQLGPIEGYGDDSATEISTEVASHLSDLGYR